MDLAANNLLLKGGVITALFWWAWFRDCETEESDRTFVLSGVVMSIVALVVARTLAFLLPLRERPRYNPALHFVLPTGTTSLDMIHWNSFPSDHAVLFFSLATCLFFISRKVGILAYCHAFFIVCLPRLYLGIHFPTDILGGALLGVGIASLSLIKGVREFNARLPLRWLANAPGFVYPCFYLGTLLVATEFDPVRTVVVAIWKAIRHTS